MFGLGLGLRATAYAVTPNSSAMMALFASNSNRSAERSSSDGNEVTKASTAKR
jgi:hypothetical protein